MRSNRLLLFVLIVMIALAGCAGPAPAPITTPTAAPAQPEPSRTLAPTLTPFPTETPWPTLTPTATETPLPTATLPPTPDPALAEIKLIGLGWYDDYDLLLSFQFPGPVDPGAYRVTLENKEYKCEVITGYPERLYCRGQGARVLGTAWVRVYPGGSLQPGFEKEVWVPYFDNDYASFYH